MSGDDGLRDRFMEQTASLLSLHIGDALPDVVADILSFADEYVRSLRAKADAADRVRALAAEWQRLGPYAPTAADSLRRDGLKQAAQEIRHALDGPSPC